MARKPQQPKQNNTTTNTVKKNVVAPKKKQSLYKKKTVPLPEPESEESESESEFEDDEEDSEYESEESESESEPIKYKKYKKTIADITTSDDDDNTEDEYVENQKSDSDSESESDYDNTPITKKECFIIIGGSGGEQETKPRKSKSKTITDIEEKTFMGLTVTEQDKIDAKNEKQKQVNNKQKKSHKKKYSSSSSSSSSSESESESDSHKKKSDSDSDSSSDESTSSNDSAFKLDNEDTNSAEKQYENHKRLCQTFREQLALDPKNKILKKAIESCKVEMKKIVAKGRNKNTTHFYQLSKKTCSPPENEYEYFKTKLSNKEQRKVIADLDALNKSTNTTIPYRLKLLQSSIPQHEQIIAMQKINVLKEMNPDDNEYFKLKHWVESFMRIPFNIYRSLPISFSDGLESSNAFMANAHRVLDECVYGMNETKMQIMQMLGLWITNPQAVGSAIALHGPPGTGKTTLIKNCIQKILQRDFAFIPLGGCSDASYLDGHSYTYEGSTYGRIVQELITNGSSNVSYYFDELDKVSQTPKGDEIVGVLTHLIDTSQNTSFHDKYFSEINFDMSRCLFFFSYNDPTLINPILKDRMYTIKTSGYTNKEKKVIARDYLLPKIREYINFNEGDVIIPDDVLDYIISNEKFSQKEQGVRTLKRNLEIIYTKLNLFRLVKPDDNKLLISEIPLKNVTFPYTVSNSNVDILIKCDTTISPLSMMYC